MPIIFARVDDRLIHGQIVQAWLPELNVDEILIPCCKDSSLNRGLLRLSLPYEYELTILDTRSCARYAAQSDRRIFLLMGSLKEFTDLIKTACKLNLLTLAGCTLRTARKN